MSGIWIEIQGPEGELIQPGDHLIFGSVPEYVAMVENVERGKNSQAQFYLTLGFHLPDSDVAERVLKVGMMVRGPSMTWMLTASDCAGFHHDPSRLYAEFPTFNGPPVRQYVGPSRPRNPLALTRPPRRW